jgi:hypothetical protein
MGILFQPINEGVEVSSLSNEQVGEGANKPVPPYYVKGLALGVTAYLIGIHLWTWIFLLPTFLGGRADFRQLYTAGYMVRSGQARQLYSYDAQLWFQHRLVGPGDIALPFNHLAYEAVLYSPFSVLPYRMAYFVFLALNLTFLGLSFRFLRPRMNNLADLAPWFPVAIFAGFLPIAAALMQGQDSILLLTLAAAAMASLEKGREFTAGLLIGLGLFKFQITLPIVLLFLVWRQLRFVAGFVVSAAMVTSASVGLVGIEQLKVYGGGLLSMSVRLSSAADQFKYGISPTAMPNLRGLVAGLAGSHLSLFGVHAITIVLSFLVLLLTAAFASAKQSSSNLLLIAITVSALVSYHLLIHDLSILLLPVAIVLNRNLAAEATADKKARRLARAAALMFVAPICFSYVPNHFYVVALPALVFLFVLVNAASREEGGMWNRHKQRIVVLHA